MSTESVAIVTGSNKGLGLAIVNGLCEKFHGIVYLTSRDENRGLEACKQLEELGHKPVYYQLDITDCHSTEKFYNHIKNTHRYIDLIVNNAGILFLKDAKENRQFQAKQTMSVNFFSLVTFTEMMLPLIRNGGKIVNISSSSGHLSRIPSKNIRNKLISPELNLETLLELMNGYLEAVDSSKDVSDGWGDSPYVVSKVGVNAYTFLLQRKLITRDISVSCVHPGYVASDMTRGSGTITPEQGAKAPLHLALDLAAKGIFMWHDNTIVPWDGPDPRGYIDGRETKT